MDKSSIHFAKGCGQSLREEIKDILEVLKLLKEKYLGNAIRCGLSDKWSFQIFKGSGLE